MKLKRDGTPDRRYTVVANIPPIELLFGEYQAGATLRDLGKKYGCSHEYIKIQLEENGLARRPAHMRKGRWHSFKRSDLIRTIEELEHRLAILRNLNESAKQKVGGK